MKNNTRPLLLITGGAGYVGSNLIREAIFNGYRVRCLDKLLYGGKSIVGLINHPDFELICGDVRDVNTVKSCLEDVDAVVHLAAIVGDKPCAAAPKSSCQINFQGTALLAENVKKKKIKRFVMASTCSNYGVSDTTVPADESRALNPVSLYAETKVDCENFLKSIANETFCPVMLRFGTAYGISFRTRFDLLVNSFAYEALTTNEIVVFGANSWRPYVHVHDMSRIMLTMLDAPLEKIGGEIFNAGSNEQNRQKWEVVEIIKSLMPNIKSSCSQSIDDKRSYRVDFTKLESAFGFKPSRTITDGFNEIFFCFNNGILTEKDYDSNKLDGLVEFYANIENDLSN